MSNPFYTASGVPAAQTRGVSASIRSEYTAVQAGFDIVQTTFNGVNTDIAGKANKAGDTYTGTHNFTGATITVPTQSAGDNSTKAASTAYVDGTFAPLNSPALTGNPTAPTPALGDNDNSIATTAFVVQQAFLTALPAQPGGSDPYQLNSVGGVASWAHVPSGVNQYLANNFGGF